MKSFKKKAICTILTVMMVGSLAACGSSTTTNNGASTNNTASKGISNVKVWISTGAEDDSYRSMLQKMETEDSSLNITDEYYPKDELNSKLQLSSTAGDAPDIIITDGLEIPYFYSAGMIACIDDKLSSDIKNDLLKSVKDEATYDGKIYATAQFDSGMGFWANKSMLVNAGVRIPTSYKNAWNRAEFEDALAKLKASGVKYPLYMRQNKPSSLYFQYLPIVRSFGGDFVNRDTMLATGTLDGAATIEAYSYISWLIEKEYVNPVCDYEDAFYGKKESALSLLGHWKYKEHVGGLGDDAIIIPLPDMGHGVFTGSGSTVWAMTTAAQKNGVSDAAWNIMEKSLSPENISLVTDVNGAIPSRISVLNTKENYKEGGRLYLYREQLEAGISYLRPLTPAHMTLYKAVQDATADIFLRANAADELHEAAASADEIIKENGWNK